MNRKHKEVQEKLCTKHKTVNTMWKVNQGSIPGVIGGGGGGGGGRVKVAQHNINLLSTVYIIPIIYNNHLTTPLAPTK